MGSVFCSFFLFQNFLFYSVTTLFFFVAKNACDYKYVDELYWFDEKNYKTCSSFTEYVLVFCT